MKGHVYKRGKKWSYLFDIDPDPLPGARRQANGSGFDSEREAWRMRRAAMKEYEECSRVTPSKRKVEEALNDWLDRIRHAVKPSMWQNWRDYTDYYVIPHIGQRVLQDIDGKHSALGLSVAVCTQDEAVVRGARPGIVSSANLKKFRYP